MYLTSLTPLASRWQLLLVLPCLLFPTLLPAQQILDAADQQPVPYATIIILGTERGTVSDDRGNFTLPRAEAADSILVSAVGYANRRLLAGDLLKMDTLQLVPRAQALARVDVTAGTFTKEKRFGSTPKSKNVVSGFFQKYAGEQVGRRMKLRKESFAKSVQVSVVYGTEDSIRCRLRFYPVAADTISLTPIPHEDVLFAIKDPQVYNIDVHDRGIILPKEVVVAVELISPPKKGQRLYFGGALFKTRAVHRAHGAAPWQLGTTSGKAGKKGISIAPGIALRVVQ